MLMWDDVSMMCYDVLVAIPFKSCLIVFEGVFNCFRMFFNVFLKCLSRVVELSVKGF